MAGTEAREAGRWRVAALRHSLPTLAEAPKFLEGLRAEWDRWSASTDIPVGTPFLVSPDFTYDVQLNRFFYSADMLGARDTTKTGYADNLAAFLNFLHRNRGGRNWRDAVEDDHVAYLTWRRLDPNGPRVDGTTWDREVSAVNRFYRWQVARGPLTTTPIPQRPARGWVPNGRKSAAAGETAATYSHSSRREKIEWFPARSYKQWRDIGVRGYGPAGLPDPEFRGRWAARNATYCDLMVRTGLRLAEQTALSTFELPMARSSATGYQRFWLPSAIAKGGSARWIYVPTSIVSELSIYAGIDRREAIEDARARGTYRRLPGPLLVAAPGATHAVQVGGVGHSLKIEHLSGDERRRFYIEGPDGLEPAMFWLNEAGLPASKSTWKGVFQDGNARCQRHGVDLHAHAHLLRHTFAVLTLEQLQRGHIASLAGCTPEQRGHYTRVFGDPLDWVRRRLGHRSIETTQMYLHALAELEMETRLALVPDGWEDPRELPVEHVADDVAAEGHDR